MIRSTTPADLAANQPSALANPAPVTSPAPADLVALDDWETSLAETPSAGPAAPLDSTGLDGLPTEWQDSPDEHHQPGNELGDVDPTATSLTEESSHEGLTDDLPNSGAGAVQDVATYQAELIAQTPGQPADPAPEMDGTNPPEFVNETTEHQSKHTYPFTAKIREIRHDLMERRLEIRKRVGQLEHEIAEHHATMQRLAAERKAAKESMDEAGEERRGLVDEWQGIEYDLANPEMLEARARQALADEAKAAGSSPAAVDAEPQELTIADETGQHGAKFAIPPNVRVVSIPAGTRAIDPASTAPLSVLKISPGRLEALRGTEATPGRNCSTVADLELLIREGRLQHVHRFGPAAVDAVTDALIDWRKKNPVPQPVERVERVEPAAVQVEQMETEDEQQPEDLSSNVTPPAQAAPETPEDLADDPEETAWWRQGAAAALTCQPVHANPHQPGTRAAKLWDRGWQEQVPTDDLED